MPDSGHHYRFICLEDEQFRKLMQNPRIKELCPEETEEMPWQQHSEYSWIRYRLGKNSDDQPGIWVVVETNLGTVRRGRVCREKREVGCPSQPDAIRNKTPYAFENASDLSNEAHKKGREGEKADSMDVKVTIPDEGDSEHESIALTLEIIWQVRNPSPIDVDLMVDFGNTRTVVLALEDISKAADGKLFSVCKPVPFLPRGHEFPDPDSDKKDQKKDQVIADSWFLLQEPLFYEYDIPPTDGKGKFRPSTEYDVKEVSVEKGGWWLSPWGKKTEKHYYVTERIPQMFVEIAPVIMGKEAGELLADADLERGENLSMSSPKRYLWDTELCKGGSDSGGLSPWCMLCNSWSRKQHHRRDLQFFLSGQICLYMYNGKDNEWDIDHPPMENPDITKRPSCMPDEPTYPRRTTMMWSALCVLESAYRQITSYNWRKGNSDFTARRLRSVHVTFPSGWIAAEREAYRKAWEQAINVFTLAHFESRSEVNRESTVDARPKLHMELDEAVASQLPFIYSEVRRLNSANAWIRLYGRPHGHKHSVRVMTVDIGGGTMDTSIVEYHNNAPAEQVALKYRVIFRDSNTFAGDNVVLNIIQRVLLPAMLEAKGIGGDSEDGDADTIAKFVDILGSQRSEKRDRAKWQRITKMLFIPIVRQWLSDVANFPKGYYEYENGEEFRKVKDMTDERACQEFNEYLEKGSLRDNFLNRDNALRYKKEDINACICEGLENGITPLGKFVAAYDVDVVTLSGKITEMPVVGEMLREKLPICAQRIVPMKDFIAGDWYPMGDHDKITDAKTVTAVGAALFAAGGRDLIRNWMLSEDKARDGNSSGLSGNVRAMRNYWGIPKKGKNGVAYGFSGEPILRRDEDTNESHKVEGTDLPGCPIMPGNYIGRAKYNTKDTCVEQQYYFRMRDKDRRITSPLAVVFARKTTGEDDDIEIVEVRSTDPDADGEVTEGDVELALHTLKEGGFWMDECRFEVELNAE